MERWEEWDHPYTFYYIIPSFTDSLTHSLGASHSSVHTRIYLGRQASRQKWSRISQSGDLTRGTHTYTHTHHHAHALIQAWHSALRDIASIYNYIRAVIWRKKSVCVNWKMRVIIIILFRLVSVINTVIIMFYFHGASWGAALERPVLTLRRWCAWRPTDGVAWLQLHWLLHGGTLAR